MHIAITLRVGGSEECRVEDTVFDVTTDKFKAFGEETDINIVRKRRTLWDGGFPQHFARIRVGELEFDDELHAAEERGVDVMFIVGSKDGYTVVCFNLLQ